MSAISFPDPFEISCKYNYNDVYIHVPAPTIVYCNKI